MHKFESQQEEIVFLRSYIKQLRNEKGILQSELDETKFSLNELKNTLSKKEKLTPEEKIEIKKGEYYLGMKRDIKNMMSEISKLRHDKEFLITKLNKLYVRN